MSIDIYRFIFGMPQAVISEMIRFEELVDPPIVSFNFPLAVEYQEMLHDWEPPEMYPSELENFLVDHEL